MNKKLLRLAALALALSMTLAVTPRRAEAVVFFFTKCVNHQEQICTGECNVHGVCFTSCKPDGKSC